MNVRFKYAFQNFKMVKFILSTVILICHRHLDGEIKHFCQFVSYWWFFFWIELLTHFSAGSDWWVNFELMIRRRRYSTECSFRCYAFLQKSVRYHFQVTLAAWLHFHSCKVSDGRWSSYSSFCTQICAVNFRHTCSGHFHF